MPSATAPASRSPSPPPPAPIADAPGPRATGLISVFNNAVKATLDKCSYSSFASCFPTAAQYKSEILDDIRRQIIDQLDRTWKANFENVLKGRDVVKGLNELDRVVEDAKTRKKGAEEKASQTGGEVEEPVPPHTLPPSIIHLAHLMPFLEEQTATLNDQLGATQAENLELLSTIQAQRAEMEALVQGLENVVNDLEASSQRMGQDDVQGLSGDIKELETNMMK